MNTELNEVVENEVEYAETNNKHSKRFKKYELLIFLGCLAFAFTMWCYANYIDDPIIQKDVDIYLVYEGDGSVVSNPTKIVIYGEESKLSNISEITVNVDAGSFSNGANKITIEIDLPEDVYSHNNEIEVELRNNTK